MVDSARDSAGEQTTGTGARPARRTLHPQAAAFLRSVREQGLTERDQHDWILGYVGPAEEVTHVYDATIGGSAGSLRVRVYRPSADVPLPVVCYFHGGGWASGSLAHVDSLCRSLAARGSAVVLSVDYRLAPEHPFPAAVEDCFSALAWAAANAADLGGDPLRLAVAGESAGGQLAAAVALLARDRQGPLLGLQILIYPALDAACAQPSFIENAEVAGVTAEEVRRDWQIYLAGADPRDPLASPLRAAELHGLPPAVVITAEFDVLRDEGEAYAARLASAGVPVVARRFAGQLHGFITLAAIIDDATEAVDEVCSVLGAILGDARKRT